MWNAHHKIGVCLRSATVVASIVLAQATLAAGSEATAQAANPVNERYHVDVTKLFATHCS